MKKSALLLSAILFIVCCQLKAQNTEDANMKAWQAYMTPGDVHKMMAKDTGEWNEDITMWMSPGTPPLTYKASCVNTMILGGRYQKAVHTGNMMGMPFEGLGITGYDNAKKVFVTSWIDNFGTGLLYMEGIWDAVAKSITFTGKSVDPMTGKDTMMKQVLKFIDDKTQVLEMYMPAPDGKEFKTMEIKLTKK
ncbi:hypothetical protein C3K47_03905 [Solitalea longa]|uniref:DUF1579 domain-containing protein n=1 Tax=Solitalea longa TaxID=2079460 RepID=A0A2S5A8D1_9SPHI|nr:DUF1579 domain-containing protein [Solitalea longa]POY38549.1 hypothetical protein C3K47_03905 [Solitalea longa]